MTSSAPVKRTRAEELTPAERSALIQIAAEIMKEKDRFTAADVRRKLKDERRAGNLYGLTDAKLNKAETTSADAIIKAILSSGLYGSYGNKERTYICTLEYQTVRALHNIERRTVGRIRDAEELKRRRAKHAEAMRRYWKRYIEANPREPESNTAEIMTAERETPAET